MSPNCLMKLMQPISNTQYLVSPLAMPERPNIAICDVDLSPSERLSYGNKQPSVLSVESCIELTACGYLWSLLLCQHGLQVWSQ